MKIGKISLLILCMSIGLFSCKKDDDASTEIEVTPPRDRDEVQAEDDDEIINYLKSHYYNSDDFGASNTNPSIVDLVITKLADDETVAPVGKTLLWDAKEEKDVTLEGADYVIYILDLNKNVSATAASPTFADNVLVTYEGFTLDNEVFDSAVTPVDFDLTGLVTGWRKVLPSFKIAESGPVDNGDGTETYPNHGVGVMFLPSGLAYFNNAQTDIDAYTPIAFKFDLLGMTENDHDNDGIPSHQEDLNNDGNLITFNFLADDDTDEDGMGNFNDADDDNDGVPTINELEPKTYTVNTNDGGVEPTLADKEFEISRSEDAGIITIKTVTIMNSNDDDIDDYLDPEITINYNSDN